MDKRRVEQCNENLESVFCRSKLQRGDKVDDAPPGEMTLTARPVRTASFAAALP
jgi:hypothetical protein